MSASVNDCRANGGGAVGNGCVGQLIFARRVGLRHGPLLDRPQRRARDAIEDVDEALLARLCDGRDRHAVVHDGQQLRCRRQVVVPQIVVDRLEVPEPLAAARVEREQAVAEQILAVAVAAVEVVARSARRHVDDAELGVDRRLAPVVHAAVIAEPCFRPRIGAELAGSRHGVEDPQQHARADVVRMNVGRRRGVAAAAGRQRHDDGVLENPARVVGLQRANRRDVAVEPDAQIDAAVGAEGSNRLAGLRVDRCEMPGIDVQQPLFAAVGAAPVIHAARADGAFVGVRPELAARRGVECDDRARPSRARTSCCRRRAD